MLERYCNDYDKPPLALSPEAIQAITTYSWPGNVRELENAMHRVAILCEEGQEVDHELLAIDLDLVPYEEEEDYPEDQPRVTEFHNRVSSKVPDSHTHEDLSLEDYFQRFVIENQETMSETELARKLGVSRKCLWERRQKLGIPRKKVTSSAK